jgi:hypothetical protein
MIGEIVPKYIGEIEKSIGFVGAGDICGAIRDGGLFADGIAGVDGTGDTVLVGHA